MLDFSRKEFSKAIGLSPKRRVKIKFLEKLNRYKKEKLSLLVKTNPSKKEIAKINLETVVSFIEMSSVSNNGYIETKVDRTLQELKKGGFTYFKENDILIAKITPSMENGKCAIAKDLTNGLGLGSSEFNVIRVNSFIESSYLFNILNHDEIRVEAEKQMTGSSGHRRVPISFYENLQIPLPPLTIQKEIVKACKVVDDEVERANSEIRELRNYISNIIGNISGKKVKIEEVFKTSSGGTPLSSKNEFYNNGNIFWVNSGELKNGLILDTRVKITKLGLENSSAKLFPINTVLVAMYGATTGEVGILGVEASTNQAVCGIFPNYKKVIPLYLYYYLRERTDDFKALSKGVARSNISQEVIKNFKIIIPSIEVQKEIVSQIEKLETKITKAKTIIEGASKRKESVLKKYL
jgi:restriction endonuclease S subunit